MKLRKPTKTWQKTRKPNLLRHKSGRYYARAFAGGKEVWKSLKTSHYSVAEAKLAEFLEEHRERVSNGNGEVSAKMTFGEALEIHQQNQADDVTIKPTTRHYWNQIFVALLGAMNPKLDADNPADREKLRRAILDLVAARKMPKQKGYG